MPPGPDRLLVISDAGLPALVASLLWPEAHEVTLWVPPLGSPVADAPGAVLSDRHLRAAEAQADLLGLAGVERGDDARVGSEPTVSRLLLLACEHAVRLGCQTVAWPTVCGEDLAALANAADRARLITRLTALESPDYGWVGVRTPLADLTDLEVAQLAVDLDAPLETLWWRTPALGSDADEAAQAPRIRWEGVLRDAAREAGFVGVPDPSTGRSA